MWLNCLLLNIDLYFLQWILLFILFLCILISHLCSFWLSHINLHIYRLRLDGSALFESQFHCWLFLNVFHLCFSYILSNSITWKRWAIKLAHILITSCHIHHRFLYFLGRSGFYLATRLMDFIFRIVREGLQYLNFRLLLFINIGGYYGLPAVSLNILLILMLLGLKGDISVFFVSFLV